MKIFFKFLIVIELIAIIFLVFKIYKQHTKVLGEISVNPIKSEELNFSQGEEFKYFYEPKGKNITIKEKPSWLDYEWIYTLNSDNLNERFDYSFIKPNGVFRIVAIGDSHTFGLYVNTKDNYPEKLEDLLNQKLRCQNIDRFEVINLGMPGYDAQYAAYRFKIRGQKYNPDLILWFLKSDDLDQDAELMATRREDVKKRLGKSNKYDPNNPSELYLPSKIAQDEIIKEYGEVVIIKKQVDAIENLIKNLDSKILLFTYSDAESKYSDPLKNIVSQNSNAYFYDGFKYPDLNRLPDSHPSAKGYKFLADKLFNELLQQKIIRCD